MDGGENDLAVSEILVQREGWNRADCVTYSNVSNIFAHRVDNTGSFVSQTCRKFYGFDIFVIAPHRLGTVNADRFDLDTNFTRAGSGNLRLDEFEDFRPSGFRKLDGARHDRLRGWHDVELWQSWRTWLSGCGQAHVGRQAHHRHLDLGPSAVGEELDP